MQHLELTTVLTVVLITVTLQVLQLSCHSFFTGDLRKVRRTVQLSARQTLPSVSSHVLSSEQNRVLISGSICYACFRTALLKVRSRVHMRNTSQGLYLV